MVVVQLCTTFTAYLFYEVTFKQRSGEIGFGKVVKKTAQEEP